MNVQRIFMHIEDHARNVPVANFCDFTHSRRSVDVFVILWEQIYSCRVWSEPECSRNVETEDNLLMTRLKSEESQTCKITLDRCFLLCTSSRLIWLFFCRTIELIALIAISSTLFLFLHTIELHSRLRKMEVRLQPGEDEILSANQLSSGEFFTPLHLLRTFSWSHNLCICTNA